MLVLGYPVKDKDSASCRIRYYIFLENLPDGWKYERYKPGKPCDVIYIQKKTSDETIGIIRDARQRGIPVVYDRDDIRRNWKEERYDVVMDNVSAVTTDTEIRAKEIRKFTKTPVYVVPDCLDYWVRPGNKIKIREGINKVVTFGRWKGVEAAAPYFARCSYPTYYFCDRKIVALHKSKLKKWNRKKFIQKLRKYDVAIVAHKNNWVMEMKSNNRLLVAMSIGMPVLAMQSPAYSETLEEAKHPELIVNSPKEVHKKLNYLKDSDVRREISQDLFSYAWTRYKPEESGRMLADVFKKVAK